MHNVTYYSLYSQTPDPQYLNINKHLLLQVLSNPNKLNQTGLPFY